jgi:hypothetical protein
LLLLLRTHVLLGPSEQSCVNSDQGHP